MIMAKRINLDDQSIEDLTEIAKEIDEEVRMLNLQRVYISNISIAKELRKAGKIERAEWYEENAQSYYDEMPDDIKW
jgi:hypothetical protein